MMRAARNRRRSRRGIPGYDVAQPPPARRGRPPNLVAFPQPEPWTEQPPSYPIHGPVVRRAIAYQQSAASKLPENAAKRASAAEIIRGYNAELNHYQTVLLPDYNRRVREWADKMDAYKLECRKAKYQYDFGD